ncbi:MAG: glucodextranase DOMON-like domain-containing protein [bacterium]
MRLIFVLIRKYFVISIILILGVNACQIKRIPVQIIEKEPEIAEAEKIMPTVNVAFIYAPQSSDSLVKLREFSQQQEFVYSLAISYDFLKQKEGQEDLKNFYKNRCKENKLSFFLKLRWDPILPLLADNSDFLEKSYLTSNAQPLYFRWPEDIRDQVALENEAFKKTWGITASGLLPYGGLLDEASLRPLLRSDVASLISGIKPNKHLSAVRVKDLPIYCISEEISSMIYYSPNAENSDMLVQRITEVLQPSNDIYFIMLDERFFNEKRKLNFFTFLDKLVTGLKEADINIILPEQYVRENSEMVSSINMNELGSGSWLSTDFSPWIGEQEEDVAWEMLARCRQAVEEYKDSGKADIRRLDSAMEEIYSAESSYNFYYFGNDFNSPRDQEIDQLFRAGLLNVYRLIKESPPEDIYQPINLFKSFSSVSDENTTSVEIGEDFCLWTDPSGDDYGDGNLVYPASELLQEKKGLADLLKFGFSIKDEDTMNFSFSISNLDNFWNAPMGFSFPLIDLYIDLNKRYGAGSKEALTSRGVVFSDIDAWEYVIVVNGWSSRLYRYAGKDHLIKVASLESDIDLRKRTISVSIPRKIIRGNPFNWGYAVLVMGYSRFIMKDPPEPIEVKAEATEDSFGTTAEDKRTTPVVDILTPVGEFQKDILKVREYYNKAVVPMLRLER